ncbi:MAG: M15 family metallopeptidase [Bdellovibrionales bacterium]|nr:M15 family metallopeptidase [Bdellovibrionales bacterium]
MANELIKYLEQNGFVEISASELVRIDLRYGTTNNFVGRNVYGHFNRAFLHPVAATKLQTVLNILRQEHPTLCLVILDALRPRWAQKILWDKVKGTSGEPYVANPTTGSVHNFGLALDVTLAEQRGGELDMGTAFDDFTPLAQPALEEQFLREGKLSSDHIVRRQILRQTMVRAGFLPIAYEWWHFDALARKEIRSQYKIVE